MGLLSGAASGGLRAAWGVLHPDQETAHTALPEVHQAILGVTRDATRVADLLEEFFAAQAGDDPGLRGRFLAFMSAQAHTSYSLMDNQLSWVLWLYSVIWMPLLVITCLGRATRTGPSAAAAVERGAAAGTMRTPASAGLQQQRRSATRTDTATPRAGSRAATPLRYDDVDDDVQSGFAAQRRGSYSSLGVGGARTFGDGGSVRSSGSLGTGSLRSLRRSLASNPSAHSVRPSVDGGWPLCPPAGGGSGSLADQQLLRGMGSGLAGIMMGGSGAAAAVPSPGSLRSVGSGRAAAGGVSYRLLGSTSSGDARLAAAAPPLGTSLDQPNALGFAPPGSERSSSKRSSRSSAAKLRSALRVGHIHGPATIAPGVVGGEQWGRA